MSKQSNKKVYKNNQRKPKTQASNVNGSINAASAKNATNTAKTNAHEKSSGALGKSGANARNSAKKSGTNADTTKGKSGANTSGLVVKNAGDAKGVAMAKNTGDAKGVAMAKNTGDAKGVIKEKAKRAKGSRTKMAANYNAAALDEAKTNKDAHLKASNGQKNQTNDFTDTKQRHITKRNTPTDAWLWAIIIIGGVLLAGGLATLLGGQMFNFRAHTLPQGVVPKVVFPIAWAAIYIMLGVSAFLAFLSPNQNAQTRRGDIIWFSINLLFNIMWPLFFFRLDLLIISTIICGIVLVTAIITNYRFYYRNLAAGILYSIYTLWLMYAFYLNLGICLLNA